MFEKNLFSKNPQSIIGQQIGYVKSAFSSGSGSTMPVWDVATCDEQLVCVDTTPD
jgi:hypothetical protein